MTPTMKSILFNTEMVRAILDGRKTQTRRVAKTIQEDKEYSNIRIEEKVDSGGVHFRQRFDFACDGNVQKNLVHDGLKPKYQVGDVLYVRETWCYGKVVGEDDEYGNSEFWLEQTQFEEDNKNIFYKADMEEAINKGVSFEDVTWKLSILMPKKYARIFLCVTNIRVERLQDINADDICTEGLDWKDFECDNGQSENDIFQWWKILWNSTAKEGYKWEDNPYVFVYEFKRMEK